MAEKYESVVIYGSWLTTARKYLPENDACKLMVQLMEYGLSGKIPDNSDDRMNVVFDMARPNIDSNIRKKEAGKKGGRGHKKEEDKKTYGLTSGLTNANVNANANANDNGNVNDNALSSADTSCPFDGAEDTALKAKDDEPDWMKE